MSLWAYRADVNWCNRCVPAAPSSGSGPQFTKYSWSFWSRPLDMHLSNMQVYIGINLTTYLKWSKSWSGRQEKECFFPCQAGAFCRHLYLASLLNWWIGWKPVKWKGGLCWSEEALLVITMLPAFLQSVNRFPQVLCARWKFPHYGEFIPVPFIVYYWGSEWMDFQRRRGGILSKNQQVHTGSWDGFRSKVWERLVLFINCRMCRGL